MASYRGHLTFAAALGAAYGGVAAWQFDLDWGPVFLGAGLTMIGGFLPDLDSDSGVPVRELFGLTAAGVPFVLFRRFQALGYTLEQVLALLGGVYIFIRYGLSAVFRQLTVHRGMFHSLPALAIAGLLVFLGYHSPDITLRCFLAGGVMLGFLSHLLLDELCGVDLLGAVLRRPRIPGSCFKLYSSSWSATAVAYGLLALLGYLAHLDWTAAGLSWPVGRVAARH